MAKEIVVSNLNQAEVAVKDVELRFTGVVYDVETILGDTAAKEAKKALCSVRTSIEATRKALKQPFIDEGRKIDDLAKALTERVVALETPLLQCFKTAEKAAEAKAKAESDAKANALEEEVAALRAQLAKQTILNEKAAEQVTAQLAEEAADKATVELVEWLMSVMALSLVNARFLAGNIKEGCVPHVKFEV